MWTFYYGYIEFSVRKIVELGGELKSMLAEVVEQYFDSIPNSGHTTIRRPSWSNGSSVLIGHQGGLSWKKFCDSMPLVPGVVLISHDFWLKVYHNCIYHTSMVLADVLNHHGG